jgi:hypothetical protein
MSAIIAALRDLGRPASAQEVCDAITARTGECCGLKAVVRQLKRGPFKTSRNGWVLAAGPALGRTSVSGLMEVSAAKATRSSRHSL